jgi:hypothetical protein
MTDPLSSKSPIYTLCSIHDLPLSLLVNSIGGVPNKLSLTGLELMP